MEWTFNRGDWFHWTPFRANLCLIDIESGVGRFVEAKGWGGPLKDGGEIYEWPLDQYVLQGLHITKVPNRPKLAVNHTG
jgi:hypothetical protein